MPAAAYDRTLLARVRAQLRDPGLEQSEARCHFGEVCGERAQRSVERTGMPAHLTPIKYRRLANAGKLLTHRQRLREK